MNFGKFLNIAKSLGAGLVSSHPIGAAAIAALNLVLPSDEKIPEQATGQQFDEAFNSLPPEAQASLAEKKIDLEIAQEEGWTERYVAMCKGDGQSTRPKIALLMAYAVLLVDGLFAGAAFYALVDGDAVTMTALKDLQWLIVALNAIPASVLNKYFGELRKEQNARLSHKPEGAFSSIIKAFKG